MREHSQTDPQSKSNIQRKNSFQSNNNNQALAMNAKQH